MRVGSLGMAQQRGDAHTGTHGRSVRGGHGARRSLGSCLVTCQGHDRLSDGVSDIPDGVSGECREHVMKRNGEESRGKDAREF